MDVGIVSKGTVQGRKGIRSHRWSFPLALGLAAGVALSIDIAVGLAVVEKKLPAGMDRTLSDWLEVCEIFGHGFGATLIVIAVAVLDPLKRRCVPWLLAASLGSGLVANLLKYAVPRTRPRDFDLSSGSVWDTFVRTSQTSWGMHSFPSAHTATAVGLAMMLSALYPRGRWFFAILAFLVGVQRVAVSAHFPSDVFAGAAVGWLCGTACVLLMSSPDKAHEPGHRSSP